jgi:hypothetical protein
MSQSIASSLRNKAPLEFHADVVAIKGYVSWYDATDKMVIWQMATAWMMTTTWALTMTVREYLNCVIVIGTTVGFGGDGNMNDYDGQSSWKRT